MSLVRTALGKLNSVNESLVDTSYLYHYTGLTGLIGILKDKKIIPHGRISFTRSPSYRFTSNDEAPALIVFEKDKLPSKTKPVIDVRHVASMYDNDHKRMPNLRRGKWGIAAEETIAVPVPIKLASLIVVNTYLFDDNFPEWLERDGYSNVLPQEYFANKEGFKWSTYLESLLDSSGIKWIKDNMVFESPSKQVLKLKRLL